MENFCQIGKLEHKEGYDVCRNVKRQGDLRYDLTRIFPGCQTAGHYHFDNEPELYEMISGEARFLTHNRDASQTYIIEAKEKDKIIFPPGFSMRTINPSKDKELVVSNWISDKTKNDYNAFKNLQEPVKLKPKQLPKELENLEFLTQPEKYKEFLTIEKLYNIIK